VLYGEQDDSEVYRGNRGRVAGPVTQAQQQQMFARDEDLRRQAGLRDWLKGASKEEIQQQKELVSELRALDKRLDGRSSISDAWADALGVEEPADGSVAEYHLRVGR
jgi:hypothetical protein